MSQTQLQLVDFSQAKKLKELGFNYPVRAFYELKTKSIFTLKPEHPTEDATELIENSTELVSSCPTIQLAFLFLRNEKGTNIAIGYDLTDSLWYYDIYRDGKCQGFDETKTFEEAEHSALNKALELCDEK